MGRKRYEQSAGYLVQVGFEMEPSGKREVELKIGAVRELKSLHAHANDDTELAEDHVSLFELTINLYASTSS